MIIFLKCFIVFEIIVICVLLFLKMIKVKYQGLLVIFVIKEFVIIMFYIIVFYCILFKFDIYYIDFMILDWMKY